MRSATAFRKELDLVSHTRLLMLRRYTSSQKSKLRLGFMTTNPDLVDPQARHALLPGPNLCTFGLEF